MREVRYGARSLDEPQIQELVRFYREGEQMTALAQHYAIDRTLVYRIVRQRLGHLRFTWQRCCSHCGQGFIPHRGGHLRQYCSLACNQAAYYQRKQERKHGAHD